MNQFIRKYLGIFLAGAAVLSMTACGKGTDSDKVTEETEKQEKNEEQEEKSEEIETPDTYAVSGLEEEPAEKENEYRYQDKDETQ